MNIINYFGFCLFDFLRKQTGCKIYYKLIDGFVEKKTNSSNRGNDETSMAHDIALSGLLKGEKRQQQRVYKLSFVLHQCTHLSF